MTPMIPAAPSFLRRRMSGALPLVALAAVALVPVLAFTYFPTTDGGAHVANADVLLQYSRPIGSAYHRYYELNPLPVPNSLGHFTLALLMSVFPPLVAEKIFINCYVLLLPLSVRYAARGVKRSSGWVAFIAVPLSLNWIFHQGFYNFLISVAVFFFLIGFWLRRRDRMTVKRAVVLGLLGLLLYAGHLLSITLACAAIFILAAWFTAEEAWRTRARIDRAALWPGFRSRMVVTFAGLLPAILLVVWFQRRGFAGKPAGMKLAILNGLFWKNLATLSVMVSYRQRFEAPLAMLLAAGIIVLIGAVLVRSLFRRNLHRRDGLILLPMAFAALYFTRGDFASGQLFIPQRLVFYTYLTALLFLAAQSFPLWVKRGVIVGSTLLAVAFTAARWPAYREYNAQLDEFIGLAEKIAPQSTLLPLVLSPRGSPNVVDPDGLRSMPFYSAAGYAAVNRQSVDLRNYEAGLDYFPVRFKAAMNPYKHLAVLRGKQNGLEMVPQVFDLRGYTNQTGGRADYVVVWGANETFAGLDPKSREAKLADKAEMSRQLGLDYTLIDTSPSGRTQLWVNRN